MQEWGGEALSEREQRKLAMLTARLVDEEVKTKANR
jgi:hypothetical protein